MAAGLRPEPLGQLKRSAIWGLLLRGGEGGSRERGEKRRERGGRERGGREREGGEGGREREEVEGEEERKGTGPLLWILDTPVAILLSPQISSSSVNLSQCLVTHLSVSDSFMTIAL